MIQSKTDEQLKTLAEDIFKGHVFTDRHCRSAEDTRMVFMILSFLDEEQIKRLQEDRPGLIYEYLDKAGPRSINGLPSFFSAQMLNEEDAQKVLDIARRMKDAVQAVSP